MKVSLISCPECGQHAIFEIEIDLQKDDGSDDVMVGYSSEFASLFFGRYIARQLFLQHNLDEEGLPDLINAINRLDLPERAVHDEQEVGPVTSSFYVALILSDGCKDGEILRILCDHKGLNPQQAVATLTLARFLLEDDHDSPGDTSICQLFITVLSDEQLTAAEEEDAEMIAEVMIDAVNEATPTEQERNLDFVEVVQSTGTDGD